MAPSPLAPSGRQFDIPYKFLKYERHIPSATITLDGPGQDNRITQELAEELALACRQVAEEPDVHLLVVTGSNGVFSSGRTAVPDELSRASIEDRAAWLKTMRVAGILADLSIPTLVVINGDALDHGLELALAADLRIAVSHARLGITDLARGSFPWDGSTQRLPRLVGPAWARDLLLTSRAIDAGEGLAIGLVNRVVEPGQLAQVVKQLSDEITAGAPIAARYAKEAVNSGMDVSLDQGLRLEADLNVILQSTADRAEGLRSFTERRNPHYSGT
jgi:enoyl-CoA hydratase